MQVPITRPAYFPYRPDGLRHGKTVSGADRFHVWDGQHIAADITKGVISARYYYGANLISWQSDGYFKFYLFNAHGDVLHVVQGTNVLYSYDYDAFGNEKSPAAKYDGNPFRYCGEYYDREIENVYLRARYYDTSTGRFTQEDPIRDKTNWYGYCSSNPVALVDPSGLKEKINKTSAMTGLTVASWVTKLFGKETEQSSSTLDKPSKSKSQDKQKQYEKTIKSSSTYYKKEEIGFYDYSDWGVSNPFGGTGQTHLATDLTRTNKDQRVKSVFDGEIVLISENTKIPGNGNYVVVRSIIDGNEVFATYAHMDSFDETLIGDARGLLNTPIPVNAGDILGVPGETGLSVQNGHNVHIHFAVWVNMKDGRLHSVPGFDGSGTIDSNSDFHDYDADYGNFRFFNTDKILAGDIAAITRGYPK